MDLLYQRYYSNSHPKFLHDVIEFVIKHLGNSNGMRINKPDIIEASEIENIFSWKIHKSDRQILAHSTYWMIGNDYYDE